MWSLNIAQTLSGGAKLEGVQGMLLSAAPRRALRDQLKALLFAPKLLGPCRLLRMRFKPGRKLTAHYHALVRVEGANGYRARPIAVVWRLDRDAGPVPEGQDLAELQAEAVRRGVAAPFRELTADRAEWGMHLQVSPLDARFPQLVRLSDRRHVQTMLTTVREAGDGAQGQWSLAYDYTVTSVRYHPGKRHVLRYDALDGSGGGAVFAKLYTGEEGAHASGVAGRVAEWLGEHGEGVRAVRPLAYVVEDGVVLYPQVMGTPLTESLRRPGEGVGRGLEAAGVALRMLHRLPQEVVGPLQFHDFAAEVQKAAGASDHIPELLPSAGSAIDGLLGRARELHERLPQEPPTFTHGDFKSEHVWTISGQVILMDFDGRRAADPAYDIGRFLADLRLWYLFHDQSGLPEAQERFLAGYAPGTPEARRVRARLYEVTQLIKIARRLPLSDYNWASRTERLLGYAQAVMSKLEAKVRRPKGGKSSTKVLHGERVSRGEGKFAMKLVDALPGDAKLEAVRWMLLSAAPRRALRDQLKALLLAPKLLGPCHLLRAKFKPSPKLTTYYDVLVEAQEGAGYRARPIAVVWRLDRDAGPVPEEQDLAELQAEAVRRGVAAPFRELTADRAEWGMHLQVSPLDARFPQLVRLSDRRHVQTMLTTVREASDAAQGQRSLAYDYTVSSIRYRPGQRHVLRYDALDGSGGGAVFAKLYTGEEGAHASGVAGRVAEWLAEHGEGVRAVRPLAYVVDDGVVLYPQVMGTPLTESLRRPGEGVGRYLEGAGVALRMLHRLPQEVVGPLQFHDFAAEAKQAAAASDFIRVLLPSQGLTIDGLLGRARELHERLPQEPPTFTHGDFKSDHIWATPGGLTLIDFDTSHLADPALDIGKFLAHLTLWHVTCGQRGLEHAKKRFLAGYAEGAPEDRLLRARLYQVVELVKITARRVRLFDSDWVPRTEDLIRRAETMMRSLEITLGLPATRTSPRESLKRDAIGLPKLSESGARSSIGGLRK